MGGAGACIIFRLGKTGGGDAFVETMAEAPSSDVGVTPLIKSPFTTGAEPNIA